ncbi:Brefeldin A-inhibited guanine nucleotide-exchange protein 1 [Gracilariopsis chorda]|uniref:Brefeldin A-inhibited guanine nucleotide-exchange protein 1 n=1 Tax=Gracilariopsis chorda TaxID=448386 RepID=A0A2V3IF06_9FLOR|nr:Brefeldin A-inhibited guanine nucleotide-exchange protein 1 [Gracilariopsis chorda]|eukprot:PXF40643.1 Brefeldin A-inhibited guanine nucleotide-exchange protein 1 [Gracilariopsis chorda]
MRRCNSWRVLGQSRTFNLSAMHSYRAMHYFTDVTFDNALGLHLSGFRLPGEVQKIDRIMLKYESRYCKGNNTIFSNTDAAGVKDGRYVDAVFLSNLYDRITTTEIRLTSTKKDCTDRDFKALNNTSSTMDPAQTAKQFEESETKVLFAENCCPAQDHAYNPTTNVHLALLMFETAW